MPLPSSYPNVQYIEGPLGSGKTKHLVQRACDLMSNGQSSALLVLCSNTSRKRSFQERCYQYLSKNNLAPLSEPPIYTYAGLVRTMLFDHWPDVEMRLKSATPNSRSVIRPVLGGIEDTERLLKRLIALEKHHSPESLIEFPGSETALIRQLIRRARLRSENGLSRQDMEERDKQLGQPCIPTITKLERQLDQLSYQLRLLDPNKQLDVFHGLLSDTNSLLHQRLIQQVQHLIVDDVDETIPVQQKLIQHLAPSVNTLTLAVDIEGGSRRGYLNAYPYDWPALKQLRAGETLQLIRQDKVYQRASELLAEWEEKDWPATQTESESESDSNSDSEFSIQIHPESSTRLTMLDEALELLKAQRWAPGDVAWVIPQQDPLFLQQLHHRCQQANIPTQLLSGTQRPIDHPICRSYLYLLQWLNAANWKTPLSVLEIKTILVHGLQLHIIPSTTMDEWAKEIHTHHRNQCADSKNTEQSQQSQQPPPQTETSETLPIENLPLIPDPDTLDIGEKLNPEAKKRAVELANKLESLRNQSFGKQLYNVFLEVITPFIQHREEPFTSIRQLIESYQHFAHTAPQLLEQHLILDPQATMTSLQAQWLMDVKHGVLADTPASPFQVDPDALLVGTPQKLIDIEAHRPIYVWLDTSHREWARSDNAPLYNAWVHSAVWDGSDTAFSETFNRHVIRKRAGHITRTLMLLTGKELHAFSSSMDELGFETQGDLHPCLQAITSHKKTEPEAHTIERATLRDDQQAILKFQSGTMAISAVPGAGKTFVNIELILELIQRGHPPEGILVLTYMDSAAKTMLQRLRKKIGNHYPTLPSISTIHGLAFRILTEHDHSLALLNLPNPIAILDEAQQNQLTASVAQQTYPGGPEITERQWQQMVGQCLRNAKDAGLYGNEAHLSHPDPSMDNLLKHLGKALLLYKQRCREQGVIDFTDLIQYAILLLETQPDIRAYYNQQYHTIIEDEAQDSSQMLQRLIQLLVEHPSDNTNSDSDNLNQNAPTGTNTPKTANNLIRTGDTNQSITTTFSSADPSVFRAFIEHAEHRVEMTASARCAPEVIELANQWILHCSQTTPLEDAFQPVQIKPIAGANPSLLFPLQTAEFQTSDDESEWLCQTIHRLREHYPNKSIAILTQTNASVLSLTRQLHQAGLPAISLTNSSGDQPVFQTLFHTLQVLSQPEKTQHQVNLYKALTQLGEPPYPLQFYMALHNDTDASTQHREHVLQERPLLYTPPVEINDPFLKQIYYDLTDFSKLALQSNLPALINHISQQWFTDPNDKSNGLLCALNCKQWLNQQEQGASLSPLDDMLQYFTQLMRAPRGLKVFNSTDALGDSEGNVIQVMTLHKSKGQEFDIVFMPSLQAPRTEQTMADRIADTLVQTLQSHSHQQNNPNSTSTSAEQMKHEEFARLIFVGITRAKQGLISTSHHQQKNRWGKWRNVEPAMAFKWLQSTCHPPSPSSKPKSNVDSNSGSEKMDSTQEERSSL